MTDSDFVKAVFARRRSLVDLSVLCYIYKVSKHNLLNNRAIYLNR